MEDSGRRDVLALKNTRNIQTTAHQKRRHQKENQNAGDNSRQNQGKKTPVVWARVENGQQQNSISRVTHDGGWSAEQRKTEGAMERWSDGGHQRTRT